MSLFSWRTQIDAIYAYIHACMHGRYVGISVGRYLGACLDQIEQKGKESNTPIATSSHALFPRMRPRDDLDALCSQLIVQQNAS